MNFVLKSLREKNSEVVFLIRFALAIVNILSYEVSTKRSQRYLSLKGASYWLKNPETGATTPK
jgi:hypothetical protein